MLGNGPADLPSGTGRGSGSRLSGTGTGADSTWVLFGDPRNFGSWIVELATDCEEGGYNYVG